MPSTHSAPHAGTGPADTVFRCQLRVFQACFLLVCVLPCLLLVILLLPTLATFMAAGPPRSSLLVIKSVSLLAPGALLFVTLACAANLLAACLHVCIVRVLMPELRQPQALLLQFYADPRWLKASRRRRLFPWWVGVWALIAANQRLLRLCRGVTAWTLARVYAQSRP
jgi:hypothetical protein